MMRLHLFWMVLFCWSLHQSAPRLEAAVIAGSDRPVFALGTGFDPVSNQFKQNCVEGTAQQTGGGRSAISSEIADELINFTKVTETGAGGSFDVGLFGGGISVSYYSRILKTHRRESLILNYDYIQAPWSFKKDIQLGENGRRLMSLGRDLAREQCGSEFITQINGAFRLMLSVSFDFASQDAYEYYKKVTTVKALFGLIKKSKTTIKEIKDYQNNLLIRIEGLQEGGYPERLAAILKKAGTCRADQVEVCLNTLDEALRYATDESYSGGLKQQTIAGGMLPPGWEGGPDILSYVSASYANTGIEELVDPSPLQMQDRQFAKEAQSLLSQRLRWHKSLEQRIRSLQNLLGNSIDRSIQQLLPDIAYNTQLLLDAYHDCERYETLSLCRSTYAQTLTDLKAIDETLLEHPAAAPPLPKNLRCRSARYAALEKGLITEQQYQVYESINYAPEYGEAHNSASEIIGWGECDNLWNQL